MYNLSAGYHLGLMGCCISKEIPLGGIVVLQLFFFWSSDTRDRDSSPATVLDSQCSMADMRCSILPPLLTVFRKLKT